MSEKQRETEEWQEERLELISFLEGKKNKSHNLSDRAVVCWAPVMMMCSVLFLVKL